MNTQTVTTSRIDPVSQNMNIKSLTQHEWLADLQIKCPNAFEVAETRRLNLPQDCIIATADGKVYYNWNAVILSKKQQRTSIDVWVLEGLEEDEIPQVISLKYAHRRLTHRSAATLFNFYQQYLTKNQAGKEWAKLIEGTKTLNKISKLVGYAYGMVYSYIRIYKQAPQLLDLMDKGKITFSDAEIKVGIRKGDAESDKSIEGGSPLTPEQGSKGTGDERDLISGTSIGKAGDYHDTDPLKGLHLELADGRVIDFQLSGSTYCGKVNDNDLQAGLLTRAVVEVADKNVELYTFTTADKKSHVTISIRNLEGFISAGKVVELSTPQAGQKKAA